MMRATNLNMIMDMESLILSINSLDFLSAFIMAQENIAAQKTTPKIWLFVAATKKFLGMIISISPYQVMDASCSAMPST